jgi:hypothetical protein
MSNLIFVDIYIGSLSFNISLGYNFKLILSPVCFIININFLNNIIILIIFLQ